MINRIRSRGEAKKQIQDHREKETFDKTYKKSMLEETDKAQTRRHALIV
jgi:hypothetical protein